MRIVGVLNIGDGQEIFLFRAWVGFDGEMHPMPDLAGCGGLSGIKAEIGDGSQDLKPWRATFTWVGMDRGNTGNGLVGH